MRLAAFAGATARSTSRSEPAGTVAIGLADGTDWE
jgi:hypothetical protein